MSALPPPVDLGLPDKFRSWYPGQDDLILTMTESDRRFICMESPTGSGKSLSYTTLAHLLGGRWVILTSTKGLQDQLAGDFRSMGMVDVRGKSNYDCIYLQYTGSYGNCDIGPCHSGMMCQYRTPYGEGCHYFDAVERAKRANLVVTNYSYWLAINHYTDEGLGDFDGIILDEAHEAPEEVSSFLAVELLPGELDLTAGAHPSPDCGDLDKWSAWARGKTQYVESYVTTIGAVLKSGSGGRADSKRYTEYKRILDKLKRISTLSSTRTDWVHESIGQKGSHAKGVRFTPIWPGPYTESVLFHGIPKVVFSSATVTPKTIELLGVDLRDTSYLHGISTFPVASRPVVFVKTADMTTRGTESDFKWWVNRIDQITKARMDRKGILHTVSYARAEKFMRMSKLADLGVHYTNLKESTYRMVEKFRAADPPALMVSPSLSTGYDFPMEECEYQIIGKIAFPDTRSALMEARCKADPTYSAYLAMQNLIQSCGRGMRSPTDRCETLVIDNSFEWFIKRHRDFAPPWFHAAVRRSDTVPDPLPKLGKKKD